MFGVLFLFIVLGLVVGLGVGLAAIGRFLGRRSLGSVDETGNESHDRAGY